MNIVNTHSEQTDQDIINMVQFIQSQPNSLLQNWRTVLAANSKDSMKCLMVTTEYIKTPEGPKTLRTVNILNDYILIRKQLYDDIADGGYRLSQTVHKFPSRSHWFGYPLIKTVEPDFQLLSLQHPDIKFMSKDACIAFTAWCAGVRDGRGSGDGYGGTVVMTPQGAFMKQDPTRTFEHPFNLVESVCVNPDYLIKGFIEAQRYEQVFVIRQYDDERSMPFFIGINWGNCIMLSTLPSHHIL